MRSRAVRTYQRRSIVVMSFYAAAVIAASYLSRMVAEGGPLLWLIALLPALPLLAMFWIMGLYLAETTDEYVRMLEVRKALVATGLTLAVTTVLGFLEIYAGLSIMPMFFVPVIWFAGLGVGSLVNVVLERQGP